MKKKLVTFAVLPLTALIGMSLIVSLLTTGCERKGKAEVVGCNRVRYEGHTYTINCRPGVSSFEARTTETDAAGHTHRAAFRITCSGGCVSTATPIDW